ncbi:MAG: MCE family protein [Mycobacteriaceae bacterium]|nr:MCE family protein [Mycobacteriaceae bacterium]
MSRIPGAGALRRRVRKPDFESHRHFWMGIGGALAVALLLVGSIVYAKAGIGEKVVKADFVQAAGLHAGDPVKVAGIDVGKVRSMALRGDHVEVALNVHRSVHFGPDAHASIKVSTLLGSRYVDLAPGNGKGLPHSRIAVANTSVPYNLADVIQVGTPKFESLDSKKLAATLNALEKQFGDSAPMAAQALDSVGELTKVINSRRNEFDALLRHLSTVTQILSDNRNNILVLLTQGQAIGSSVMQRQHLLRGLLNDVAALSKQLQTMGAQNQGKFGPTIQQLNTISEGLVKNRENLDRLLEIMPVTLRQFNNVVGDGNYANLYIPWLFPDNWLCFAHVIQGCKVG